MKKDILFIIPGVGAGGGEKSLVNLLNQFDYTRYNVDIFMLNKKGVFMKYIPKEVKILDVSSNYKIFSDVWYMSIFKFLFKGNFILAYNRMMFSIRNRLYKSKGKGEQYTWKYLKKAVGRIEKKYDVAIGYLEKTSNYICADCVQASKKIGWIHNDYRKLNVDKEFDLHYFKILDYLVTVSEECEKILKCNFPSEKSKVKLIHNIVSLNGIRLQAEEEILDLKYKKGDFNILSIGRLDIQKGFDMAIDAFKIVREKGYNVVWNVIGEGNERNKLEDLIKSNELQDKFNLLGIRSNPYPYLKDCDLYVQPSRFEGKSVAIDEAKILCKPILVTNFSTAKDQIHNLQDGIVVEMNSESLATAVENLIIKKEICTSLRDNLSKLNLGNEREINKLYKLINS